MTFDPKSVEVTCVTLPKDHCVHVSWKYIKVCGYSDPFFKNINQCSLTPSWPLTFCLLRSHVWLYPRIIVSKSHGNTSMYVDTTINFAKYHILHTYICTYILQTLSINSKQVSRLFYLMLLIKANWLPFFLICLFYNVIMYVILLCFYVWIVV